MDKRKKQFLSTPLFAILGRFGGILIPFLIAYYFGVGAESDAFFFVFGLFISLGGIFIPIFESLLLPYLAEAKNKGEAVHSFANSILAIKFPIILLITMVLGVALKPLLTLSTGFDSNTIQLISEIFYKMMPFFLLGILTAFINGLLYHEKIFWFPAFSPFIRSLVAILFIILFHQSMGILSVALGFTVGELFRFLTGGVYLKRCISWVPKISWEKNRSRMREFMGQAGYHLLALLALNLIPITDQWFASWLSTGNLALLSYSDRLFQLPFQLFMTGILQIFLSYWSSNYYEQSGEEFWKRVKIDVNRVFLISVACSIVLIAISKPLVSIVFGFGDMSVEQMKLIQRLFIWLMIGFSAAILNLLYVRILFVMKKTDVFLKQSLIRLLLNIVFNALLMPLWGVEGLAVGTSIVFVGTTLWLYFYIKKYQDTGLGGTV